MNQGQTSRYRVLRKLGSGGMGEVFLADDLQLERQVALKFLSVQLAAGERERQRFLAEARAASALNHPNVCVIHEVGENEDGRLHIVMEYIEGRTLDELVRSGSLKLRDVLGIAIQIADALDVAHARGIVHRDLKPANVKLTPRGQVKVLDFGLAKRLGPDAGGLGVPESSQALTLAGQVVGTPAYMSPEQVLGQSVDPRSDLFSLGAMLYELATGRSPFAGQSLGDTLHRVTHTAPQPLTALNPDAPAELGRIVHKCIEKPPERRYQAARDLLVDLKNLHRDLEAGVTLTAAPDAEFGIAARSPAPDAQPVETAGVIATLPQPAPQSLAESDVFISYARVDDQPLLEGRSGWVSQFHRNLALKVEQLSGERLKITRHPGLTGQPAVDEPVLRCLDDVKAMISVVSPPFVRSDGCWRPSEEFWRRNERSGRFSVDNHARLLKVLKTPVVDQDVPPALGDLFARLAGFEFFEVDPDTGRLREYDEAFGPEAQQHYFERIYDLAYELCQILRASRAAATTPGQAPGRTIYLAETTADVRDDRDRIQRELVERGHVVLPNGPLPLGAEDLDRLIEACLEKADCSIHLLGARYGLVPEQAQESIPELQHRLAARQGVRRRLPRLVWIPRGLETRDERQTRFLQSVIEEPTMQEGAEIIQDSFEGFRGLLIDRLTPRPAVPAKVQAAEGTGGPRRIYLVCDARDQAAIEPLEDFLFEQGFEVATPSFEGDEGLISQLHRQNLVLADAVLIYYGNASRAWVDTKLLDLLQAPGFGRRQPFRAVAVYVAPPDDRRKDRFRTHQAIVIRPTAGFQPESVSAFVAQAKSGSGPTGAG